MTRRGAPARHHSPIVCRAFSRVIGDRASGHRYLFAACNGVMDRMDELAIDGGPRATEALEVPEWSQLNDASRQYVETALKSGDWCRNDGGEFCNRLEEMSRRITTRIMPSPSRTDGRDHNSRVHVVFSPETRLSPSRTRSSRVLSSQSVRSLGSSISMSKRTTSTWIICWR